MRREVEQYITAKELAGRLRCSVRSVWRWAAEGRLPKPSRTPGRRAVWREAEVADALQRIAGMRAS